MSPITTHILDISSGKPAAGVAVTLEQESGGSWKTVAEKKTDADGRIKDLLSDGTALTGLYRLTFSTGAYFKSSGTKSFHPSVTVTFETGDQAHYHVPLLLSPFGYSTYRGS